MCLRDWAPSSEFRNLDLCFASIRAIFVHLKRCWPFFSRVCWSVGNEEYDDIPIRAFLDKMALRFVHLQLVFFFSR